MNNISRKIFALLLGVVFVILILEVGLRISGTIMKRMYLKKVEARGEVPEYRILCIGNCYTAGVGVPRGQSYPDHLQRILEDKYPGKKYVVINRGMAGRNSGQVLMNARRDILETDPDLVIVRAGSANFFNQMGFDRYLLENVAPKTLSGKIKFAMKFSAVKVWEFLYRLRSVRLVYFLGKNLREDRQDTHAGGQTRGQGRMSRDQRDAMFFGLLDKAQKAEENGNMVEAVNVLTRAVQSAPDEVLRMNLYRRLMEMADGLDESDVEILMKQNEGKTFEVRYDEIYDWVGSDVDKIIIEIEAYGIPYIIQNYPVLFAPDKSGQVPMARQVGDAKGLFAGANVNGSPHRIYMIKVNSILREYAGDRKVPFVDNEQFFWSLLKSGKNEYAGKSRYPSVLGYKFMAEKIHEKMLEEGFIEKK